MQLHRRCIQGSQSSPERDSGRRGDRLHRAEGDREVSPDLSSRRDQRNAKTGSRRAHASLEETSSIRDVLKLLDRRLIPCTTYPFAEQKLSQIGAIFACDAGDQSCLSHFSYSLESKPTELQAAADGQVRGCRTAAVPLRHYRAFALKKEYTKYPDENRQTNALKGQYRARNQVVAAPQPQGQIPMRRVVEAESPAYPNDDGQIARGGPLTRAVCRGTICNLRDRRSPQSRELDLEPVIFTRNLLFNITKRET